MRAAVIVFPGSNCDRDMVCALNLAGHEVISVWHKETELPKNIDLVAIPGGFSFGDYLRCGAIAAKSPIFKEVLKHIERGGYALGVCNGFQILTEAGVLPGILQQNIKLNLFQKPSTCVYSIQLAYLLIGIFMRNRFLYQSHITKVITLPQAKI